MICCLNPQCQQPQNPNTVTSCQSCGAELILLLRGRYRVSQPLGQGGFGKTYLAVDEDRLNSRCVIKQFSPQLQGTKSLEKAMRLFEQEAVRLHELGEHPQIPSLLAYFEHDKRLYLVQQFVEGPTLLQESQHRAFDEQKIREVLAGLLPVLKFVHDHHVIHRDITPSNIIRRKIDGKLVLIDFGVAKLLNEATSAQPGTRIGTEGYSPMEQLRGGKTYPASDLYSLGATCLYLMTRQKPDDLYDPLNGKWFWREYLAKKGVQFSDRLNQILDKMLKDLVNERYQSANDVMRDLRAALSTPVGSSAKAVGASVPASRSGAGTRMPSNPPASNPPTAPRASHPGLSRPPISGSHQIRPLLHVLAGHSSWVMTVAISSDSQTLVSGGMDDKIRVWNLQSGELLQTLSGHTKVINCLAVSPNGQTLVSGSDDHSIRFWNLQTSKSTRILREHTRDVTSVAISSNGEVLASGSEDRTVRLWKLSTGEPIRTLSGLAGMVRSVTISADGKTLASGGLDNQIRVWDLQTGDLLRTLTGHFNSVNSVAISSDGKIIASGSKDKTVKLWNPQTGKLRQSLSGHSDAVNAVAISPDNRMLVSGSNDKTVKLWNLETGELLGTLTEHTNPVSAVTISPDGKILVTGGWDNVIRVWQLSF